MGRKYNQNGFCTVNQLYSRRSINQLALALNKSNSLEYNSGEPKIVDLETEKNVNSILLTPSVEKVLTQLVGTHSINKVAYYERIPEQFCEFKQFGDTTNLELIILLSQPKSKVFALQVIPGSHKKKHSEKEKTYIVENCNPVDCQLNIGGAIMVNSALIKSFPGWFKNETVRFMRIEIGS